MDMKRLQILIEEDLDAELAIRAIRERTSKGALVRRYVREAIEPFPPIEQDPLWELVGMGSSDPMPVDDVVYGPRD